MKKSNKFSPEVRERTIRKFSKAATWRRVGPLELVITPVRLISRCEKNAIDTITWSLPLNPLGCALASSVVAPSCAQLTSPRLWATPMSK